MAGAKGVHEFRGAVTGISLGLAGHDVDEAFALVGGKPVGIFGLVGEVEEHHDAKEDRGNPFQEEEPLPGREVEVVLVGVIKNKGAEDVADDAGEGGREEEQGFGAGAVGVRNPQGQEEHDAGEEARFKEAEDAAEPIERLRSLDEHEAGGSEAPGDHDAGDPPSCADAHLDEVGGKFKDAIRNVEDRQAPTEDRGGETQLGVFGEAQLGDRHVVAIEKVHQKAQHEEGDEATDDFADNQVFGGAK